MPQLSQPVRLRLAADPIGWPKHIAANDRVSLHLNSDPATAPTADRWPGLLDNRPTASRWR